jgi:hypothetical protein
LSEDSSTSNFQEWQKSTSKNIGSKYGYLASVLLTWKSDFGTIPKRPDASLTTLDPGSSEDLDYKELLSDYDASRKRSKAEILPKLFSEVLLTISERSMIMIRQEDKFTAISEQLEIKKDIEVLMKYITVSLEGTMSSTDVAERRYAAHKKRERLIHFSGASMILCA